MITGKSRDPRRIARTVSRRPLIGRAPFTRIHRRLSEFGEYEAYADQGRNIRPPPRIRMGEKSGGEKSAGAKRVRWRKIARAKSAGAKKRGVEKSEAAKKFGGEKGWGEKSTIQLSSDRVVWRCILFTIGLLLLFFGYLSGRCIGYRGIFGCVAHLLLSAGFCLVGPCIV